MYGIYYDIFFLVSRLPYGITQPIYNGQDVIQG